MDIGCHAIFEGGDEHSKQFMRKQVVIGE